MTYFSWAMVMVLVLTLVGSAALFFVTVKYYWGERGAPPLSRAQRRVQRDAELALRARQIELSKQRQNKPRNPSFWDNRKKG